jgi:hypothetical protein
MSILVGKEESNPLRCGIVTVRLFNSDSVLPNILARCPEHHAMPSGLFSGWSTTTYLFNDMNDQI